MPCLITTLGSAIAAVCSRYRAQRNYDALARSTEYWRPRASKLCYQCLWCSSTAATISYLHSYAPKYVRRISAIPAAALGGHARILYRGVLPQARNQPRTFLQFVEKWRRTRSDAGRSKDAHQRGSGGGVAPAHGRASPWSATAYTGSQIGRARAALRFVAV